MVMIQGCSVIGLLRLLQGFGASAKLRIVADVVFLGVVLARIFCW